jgi:hypothetical protein
VTSSSPRLPGYSLPTSSRSALSSAPLALLASALLLPLTMGRPRLSSDEKRQRNTQQKANWRARAGIPTRATATSEPAPDPSRLTTVPLQTRSPAAGAPKASGAPPALSPAARSPLARPVTGPSHDLIDAEPLPDYASSDDGGSIYLPGTASDEDPGGYITDPIYDPLGRRLISLWSLQLFFLVVESIITLPRLIIRCSRIRRRGSDERGSAEERYGPGSSSGRARSDTC